MGPGGESGRAQRTTFFRIAKAGVGNRHQLLLCAFELRGIAPFWLRRLEMGDRIHFHFNDVIHSKPVCNVKFCAASSAP